MSNWPEKVWIDTSDTGIEYDPFIDYGVFPAGQIRMPNYIEYTRSDLTLPDDLKAELIRALNFGRAAHMYAASQFCDSDAVDLFNERLSLIEAAIERLNGVKS